jgi:hypothetical protein
VERDHIGQIWTTLACGATSSARLARALRKFIGRREQARILGLFGTVEIDPEYDYKAERSRR